MDDDRKTEQVRRLEAEIKRLTASAELSRRVVWPAIGVVIVVGIGLVAVAVGTLGFDPVAIVSISAALLIGIVFLLWHRRRMGALAAVLKIVDAHKAELAGKLDLSPQDKE